MTWPQFRRECLAYARQCRDVEMIAHLQVEPDATLICGLLAVLQILSIPLDEYFPKRPCWGIRCHGCPREKA